MNFKINMDNFDEAMGTCDDMRVRNGTDVHCWEFTVARQTQMLLEMFEILVASGLIEVSKVRKKR